MLSVDEYVIPPGSLILVTGVNGYIASHTVDILLSLGYKVRGTVRAAKPWLDKYFDDKYGKGRFESVIVTALDDPAAWTKGTLTNVAGLCHIASDLSFSPDPATVIPWVKQSTISLLGAAAREKSVKRFVLTSSSSAALLPVPNAEGVRVDENTWNEASVKKAWDDSTPPLERRFHTYAAAKAEQEQAAWRFVKEQHPGFDLNVVVPNCNYGRILLPEITGSSMGMLRNMLKGDATAMRLLSPQWFVNVEDTARLHALALLNPTVKGERIFAFACPFNWNDIIPILRKLRPENRLIPNPPENEGRDLSEIVHSKRAEGLLRDFFGQPSWICLEQSIAEGLGDMP
ncbi:NAD(P)-binding protein [Aspergillus cavernicola]|uniref:NAD(P)-binding protein n=1 Tax=Aspergillus cavernicola TaxID=176166 RepID=A0ABR4HHT0_9EURO